MYKGENIFDKQKCIELLKALSSQRSVQASYARKILAKKGISTDKLSFQCILSYFVSANKPFGTKFVLEFLYESINSFYGGLIYHKHEEYDYSYL